MIKLASLRAYAAHPSQRMLPILALLSLLVPMPCLAAQESGKGAPWTVRTSIELQRFANASGNIGTWDVMTGPVVPSPDGKYFFVMVQQGNLDADENIMELRVYSTDELKSSVRRGRLAQPVTSILRRSSSNKSPIADLRWTSEGDRILFTGPVEEKEAGQERVAMGLDVASGRLSILSEPILQATVKSWRGDTALYNGFFLDRIEAPEPPSYPTSRLTSGDLAKLAAESPTSKYGKGIYVSKAGKARLLARDLAFGNAWLDPQGTNAVITLSGGAVPTPTAWKNYQNGAGRLSRFQLLNVASGEMRPILDAPVGNATLAGKDSDPDVLWSGDGRTAILINAALPLDEAARERASTSYVLSYDLDLSRTLVIAPFAREGAKVAGAAWQSDGSLRLDYDNDRKSQSYRFIRSKEGWQAAGPESPPKNIDWSYTEPACADNRCPSYMPHGKPEPVRFSNGLSVLIEEGLNAPQRLVAFAGGKSVTLIEPDPLLEKVSLARSQIVEWTASDGQVERGILTLPPDASAVNPPPLVIQAYRFMPTLFRPDGPFSSPYAAQALAARGMAVLALPLSLYERPASEMFPAEGQNMVRSIDGFVQLLAARRLIDPKRVGMNGHSRGGYMTLFAATHPGSTRIRAFFDSDGYVPSFSQYLLQSNYWDGYRMMESELGGDPGRSFWQDKQDWLANGPDFNLDRVQGAFYYTMTGQNAFVPYYAATLAGGFGINRRPFELVRFSYGQHPLVRPRERYEALSAMVDWMAFWLKGDVPADKDRADRWTRMRASWERQQAWEATGNLVGSEPAADFVAPQVRSN